MKYLKYVVCALVILVAIAAGFGACWLWKVRPIELAKDKAEVKIEELESEIETLANQKEEDIRNEIKSMDPSDVVAVYLDPATLERIYRDIPDKTERVLAILAEFLSRFEGSNRRSDPGS